MPRNGSGSYTAPANSWNPPVPSTPISSSDWQTLLDDLATALTQSVATDGTSQITARIPFPSGVSWGPGSASNPAQTFTTSANTGVFSPGANIWGVAVSGVERLRVTATGVTVTGDMVVTGAVSAPGFVAAEAVKLQTARTIGLSGDVSGSASFDGSANATIATTISGSYNAPSASKLQTARTISLTGAVTGSVGFDGSANVSIATTSATPTVVAKAIVNGSTGAVTGGVNIASVSHGASGTLYGVTFSSALANANYTVELTVEAFTSGTELWAAHVENGSRTVNGFQFYVMRAAGGVVGSTNPNFIAITVAL